MCNPLKMRIFGQTKPRIPMKRIFAALTCMAVVLLVAGCGGNSNKKAKKDGEVDLNKVAENIIKEKFEGESYSKEAADFYFQKFSGIKLKDLAPEYALNETSQYTYFGDEHDALANFKIQDGGSYTKEDHENNVRRIYALTKKVADNGINMYGFEDTSDKEKAFTEKDLEQMIEDGKGTKILGIEIYMGDYGWTFKKDGVLRRCEINLLEKNDEKLGYSVKMYKAMEKTFDEIIDDAEKALSDPEVQKEVEKALKDYSK